MNLWYKIQSKIFTFIGDIKWAGILHPFWFIFNAKNYQLKGEHYFKVQSLIQPGDILIRRFEGYVDKWLIPGYFNHGGIYFGKKNEQVIHAISDGVIVETLVDFMRADHCIVLRPPKDMIDNALEKANSIVGAAYDFNFDFEDSRTFSCTEVVDYCYPGIIQPKRRFGRMTVVADDIVACDQLKTVWDSRIDYRVTHHWLKKRR